MSINERERAHYIKRGHEVLVDFDGTICEFVYPKLGRPRRGALEFLQWLIDEGLTPVVWSSRMSADNCQFTAYDDQTFEQHAQWWAIKQWLIAHGFPNIEVDDGRNGKRLAMAYVDDRGVAADDEESWLSVKGRILVIKEREDNRWKAYYAEANDSQSSGTEY